MHYRIFSILVTFVCLFGCALTTAAQDVNNTDETEKPVILYSGTPKKYEIADIKVEGAQNYEDYVIVGLSGLSKGQTITVPGDEITQACKRYWRHGLFSDVEITADKIEGDQIWLTIHLTMRPRVSDIRYNGVKKSEREDLESRIGMIKGGQITPNRQEGESESTSNHHCRQRGPHDQEAEACDEENKRKGQAAQSVPHQEIH